MPLEDYEYHAFILALAGINQEMNDEWFAKLGEQDEKDFREWAKWNDPPILNRWHLYHPVCREEWIKRGIEPPPGEQPVVSPPTT